jgi:hypothetical protein
MTVDVLTDLLSRKIKLSNSAGSPGCRIVELLLPFTALANTFFAAITATIAANYSSPQISYSQSRRRLRAEHWPCCLSHGEGRGRPQRTDGGVKERIQSSAIRERNEYKTPIDQNGGKRKEEPII